jgi:hypothetical protein
MFAALIRRLTEAVGEHDSVSVVIYAPFGIVRGEVSRAELTSVGDEQKAESTACVLAVDTATVEHYSNHLPTGNYARLLISLSEISGLVVVGEPGR